MKKLLYVYISLVISSCATYKPDSSAVSAPDYNGRIWVENPHYNKRTNIVGYTGIAVSTLVGGYLAYSYEGDLVNYNNSEGEKQSMKMADATIGALTGLTISYFLHKMFSQPKKIKVKINPKDWVKDVGVEGKFSLLDYTDNRIHLMDKGIESKFTVKNITDVKDFEKAFPKSSHIDEVLKNSIGNIEREDLRKLIIKYPKSKYSKQMQISLLDTSPNLREFFKSDKENPNSGYLNRRVKIKELVKNVKRSELADLTLKYFSDRDIDLLKYNYFDRSSSLEELYEAKEKYRGYKFPKFNEKAQIFIPTAKRETLASVIYKNSGDKFINEYKAEYINKSKNLSELLQSKEAYPEIEFDYDTKALSLINDANEIPTFIRLVKSSRTIQRGMEKIDNLMWEKAKNSNSKVDYENYIQNAPLKNYKVQAENALKRIN